MFNVNRIQLLLCVTLLIHWTSASPSSRFNTRSAQSDVGGHHPSMAGEVRNLRILTIKFINSVKVTKNCEKSPTLQLTNFCHLSSPNDFWLFENILDNWNLESLKSFVCQRFVPSFFYSEKLYLKLELVV